jgi:uncharacterized membrane protein YraQ (UPF0718 family)
MTIVVAIFQHAATTLWQFLPWVVLGVLVSEALRYTSVSPILERACRSHPAIAIPVSAVLGIVSPLCTYGTVPVVLQLLRAGVPIAPLAIFLSTSSLINPQLLLLTWGGLGPKMAVARVVVVLAFGILFGAITHLLPTRFSVQPKLREESEQQPKPHPAFTWQQFAKHGGKTLKYVGFYIVLGVLLGALVEVLVPGRWITVVFGSGGWYRILLAALLGVPLSACGGGVIPLVHGLIEQGMSPGAALAFLIAGPATRIPPLMALATIVRPFFVIAYVVLLLAYSVLAGVAYGPVAQTGEPAASSTYSPRFGPSTGMLQLRPSRRCTVPLGRSLHRAESHVYDLQLPDPDLREWRRPAHDAVLLEPRLCLQHPGGR